MTRIIGKKSILKRINKYGSAHELARHLALHDGLTDEEEKFLNEYFDSKGRKSFTKPIEKKLEKTWKRFHKANRPMEMYFFFCHRLKEGTSITDAIAEAASYFGRDVSVVRRTIKPIRDEYGDRPDFVE